MTEITDSHNLVFSCRPFAINNFFSNSHFDILDCLGKAGKGVTTLTMNPLHSAVPAGTKSPDVINNMFGYKTDNIPAAGKDYNLQQNIKKTHNCVTGHLNIRLYVS